MISIETVKRWWGVAILCLLAGVALVPAQLAAQDAAGPAVVVGRVYDVEGDLVRYVPDIKDWVKVVRDAPFGTQDTLYSGTNGMSELILPNQTWIRIGNDTQIQFIDLRDDTTEADIASGVARFYNKSDNGVVKATSDFGYVLADPGSVFDFYVGANSAEVLAIKGNVTFVHTTAEGGGARYDTAPGQPSILADKQQVTSGESVVDPDWDRWNTDRENFWAERTRTGARYAEYLPAPLQYEAPVLEEQGEWVRVPYEGSERLCWRPTHVQRDWSPFTAGRWTEWRGDQVWIPDESFGYLTHHYGNWLYTGDRWCWAPPVAQVRVGLPFLDIGYFWNPGRVSWIHNAGYVGWVPLAPREDYYCHRRWGGRHEIIVRDRDFHSDLSIRRLAYAPEAVIIRQGDYWGHNDYRRSRVRDINKTTIINNYYAAPVVNNTVINNYSSNDRRYHYTTAVVSEKPHNTVVRTIQRNDERIQRGRPENAGEIKRQARGVRQGQFVRDARIEQPKLVNYMVPAKEVNRPKSEVKFQEKQIRGKGAARRGGGAVGTGEEQRGRGRPEAVGKELRPPQEQTGQTETPGRVESPRGKGHKVQPAESGGEQRGRGPKEERVKAPRETPQEQPAQTETPGRVESPRGKGHKAQPAESGGGQRGPRPKEERARPPRETQQEQPGPTETPGQVESPRGKGHKAQPAERGGSDRGPGPNQERVKAPRDRQQEQPAQPGESNVRAPADNRRGQSAREDEQTDRQGNPDQTRGKQGERSGGGEVQRGGSNPDSTPSPDLTPTQGDRGQTRGRGNPHRE